ncbi:GGDEF domain-containing protein [Sedimenticola hydrogenitrophicus]|uniref:GGDEF domain-containing protein n=1 Tax=Sedimenticola hydrogenitrophicus TaxID=2967975 RepID=UPI0023AFB77A|nr:GGDEF domain-containing protein [Sedimenticola hydrogenitrophicus]
MSGQETTAAPDWKIQYLELAQQQAQEKSAAAETEKLLCRIIIRLTLATSGLDPVIDPHLSALRNAVRKGVQPELKDQLSAISEALIRANDETTPVTATGTDLLPRLISRSGVTGRNAGKLHKLAEQLVAEGDAASDQQIDRFLRLLTQGDNPGSASGFLRRFFPSFGASDAPADAAVTPNQQLLRLLEGLDWPAQLSLDIRRLEMELVGQKDSAVWVEVLSSLLALLSRSVGEVQTEIQDTRGFLKELTQRLVEIDKHVNSSKALRQKSMVEGQALGLAMRQRMGGMRNNMNEATTLQQLRLEIARQLDVIETHVGKFVANEGERHKQAALLEDQLRKRLDEVQSESRELRAKMIEAHRQAATDTVTGLPNRLAYEDRLEQEYARWKRFGEPLTLLVWDIDDFKRINDRFGHHAGDKALRIIGQSLLQGLRETDFVARFGGEEFVMLLTGTNCEDAMNVAETVRREVKESGIHSVGKRVEVTISCGMSGFAPGDTPADVFTRADRALYEAKRTGKDRIIVH